MCYSDIVIIHMSPLFISLIKLLKYILESGRIYIHIHAARVLQNNLSPSALFTSETRCPPVSVAHVQREGLPSHARAAHSGPQEVFFQYF